MKRLSTLFLALAVVCASAAAQTTFTFDDLITLRRVGGPQLSPDGRTVAFTIGDVDKQTNRTLTHIYTVSIDGSQMRQITKGDRSSSSPRWSPDGRRIAFTSDGQIWTMDADGDDRRQVTRLATGASNPVWSPDGQWIAFVSEVYPECTTNECNAAEHERVSKSKVQAKVSERLLYRHWAEWRDRRRTHVFIVPSRGGEPVDLTPGDYDSPPFSASTGVDFAFSPDSREIAFIVNPDKVEAISTNSDIFISPLPGAAGRSPEALWKDGAVKNITQQNRGYDVAPMYTPDGRYILYRSQATPGFEADRWRIMRRNRKTGETIELTAGFDLQADQPVVSPDGKTVYFPANSRGREPIYSVPLEPQSQSRASGGRQVVANGFFSNLSITPDGRSLVALSSSMTAPPEVFRIAVDGGDVVNLSRANKPLNLTRAEEIEWKGTAGTGIHGFLVKPATFDPARKYPLLVLIHGGPQGAWNDAWSYRWNAQVFANAGYVVFMPNPRGSTGYGQKFVNEISGDWGGKVYTDLMNGVAEVIKKPYIDKERIGAAGASYGGYMVNWILGHNNDPRFRFKALVSHAGVYNLESMATATEELWFVEWEFKGMPWENPAVYQRWSPHRFARNFKTPTLVVHGELDYRVPVGEGLQLYTALQRQNVPSKIVIFPDEGHWILKPQNSEFWYGQVLGWLDRYLKP